MCRMAATKVVCFIEVFWFCIISAWHCKLLRATLYVLVQIVCIVNKAGKIVQRLLHYRLTFFIQVIRMVDGATIAIKSSIKAGL